MTTSAHPLLVAIHAAVQAFEAELAREDAQRGDLESLRVRTRVAWRPPDDAPMDEQDHEGTAP